MMKKFTAAVILGAIVGAVAYKLKKEYDDKKELDKELEMLSGTEEGCTCECGEECTCDEECTCECEKDSVVDEIIEEASEVAEEAKKIVYEVVEDVQEVVEDVKEAVEEKIEEAKEVVEDIKEVIEEKVEENTAGDEPVEKKTAFLEESLEETKLTANLDEDFKKELDIHSDSIIHQLNSENDELKVERPIQHTIDFKSLDDLEAYKALVIEKGYVATKGDNPYQLSVLHIAPINRSELLVNVYYLANLANKHNATYLGWQSRKVL